MELKQKRDKKWIRCYTPLLAAALAMALGGCGQKEAAAERNVQESTAETVNAAVESVNTAAVNAGGKEQASAAAAETAAVPEDYDLEAIAALNGVEVSELNALGGPNGELVFLGNKYGEETITNETEAQESLQHVKTLAGLEGVNLQYNRTDVSPVTGNVVYTFYQTAETKLNGQTITAKFFNSLIKVVTDKDGNLLGVSADIVPESDVETIPEGEIISREEAIAYVRQLLDDENRTIYEDNTEYAFWDDQVTVSSVTSDGKVVPAWFVYTDAEPDNPASKPYEVFAVSLLPQYLSDEKGNDIQEAAVIANFYVETLDPDDMMDLYTSLFYFDGMKEAGEYTYEIDMDWVKAYYPDYQGPETASYTVPVMYSEKEDLYYLGDADKKITLSNYYDFSMMGTTNACVTKNPEDKNSWQFQLDKAPDGSTGDYFQDPDYILSSFSVMCDVWNDFYERYGLDSVDNTGMPTILLVYQTAGYDYPEEEQDFFFNATNIGQDRDWQVMATSITFPGCLEHEVMAHEYTHGINGQLTMSQYLNGPGAVMESYADIVGEQISMLNGYPECSDEQAWRLGGRFGLYMRNMADPAEFCSPKYLGGNYYLNPVEEVIGDLYDMGGVHTNSSILNYLAYCMVNGTGAEGEATLTMDENLDVWFDTLYYTNYQSDYYDVAGYLQLSADSLGLAPEKCAYLRTLLQNFALIPGEDGERHLAYEEDSDYYHITLEYDDTIYDDLPEMFRFGFTFFDAAGNYFDAGGMAGDGNLYYAVEKGMNFEQLKFALGNQLSYESGFYKLDEMYAIPHEIELFFKAVTANEDTEVTTDPGFEILQATTYDDMDIGLTDNEDGSGSMEIHGEGTVVAVIKNQNESTDDFGTYTILMVICGD